MYNIPYVPLSGSFARRYMFKAFAAGETAAIGFQLFHNFSPSTAVFARPYRFFFFPPFLGSKTTCLLQITCNKFISTKTLPQMSLN